MGTQQSRLLLEAASTGNVEQLLQLLNRVPVNSTDDDGWTALHFSSWAGRTAAVKELLAHGANIHAIDKVKTFLLSNPMQTACACSSMYPRVHAPQKSKLGNQSSLPRQRIRGLATVLDITWLACPWYRSSVA